MFGCPVSLGFPDSSKLVSRSQYPVVTRFYYLLLRKQNFNRKTEIPKIEKQIIDNSISVPQFITILKRTRRRPSFVRLLPLTVPGRAHSPSIQMTRVPLPLSSRRLPSARKKQLPVFSRGGALFFFCGSERVFFFFFL